MQAARRIALVALATATLLPAVPSPLTAQAPGPTRQRLRVFLECRGVRCDFDYMRREIGFVDWMRDPSDADVHILGTAERTGSGGQSVDLAFLGSGDYSVASDTLQATTLGTDTEDERRGKIARVLRAGLVPFLAQGGQLGLINIQSVAPGRGTAEENTEEQTTPEDDPWNFWVFNVGVNGFLNGESSSSSSNTFLSLDASRTTEEWKASIGTFGSYNSRTFTLSSGEETFITRNFSASASLVRSLTDQWSAGAQANAFHDTRLNQDFTFRFAPALEYNLFPYVESSRRQLVVQYSMGFNSFDYTEETLLGETAEILIDHTLAAAIEQTQPWGSLDGDVTASQFLNRTSKYSVNVSGGANLRLTRGLTFRLRGNYSWIRDQVHLSAASFEDDEILLRLRDLETSFRYFTSFGFTYRFGSIFNNVVNPRLRFRGRGGGGFFF